MLSRYGRFAVVFGAAAALLAGCKGDDSSGTGGAGGKAPDAPVVLPPNPSGQSCENGESTCDDQESVNEYADCIVTTCDSEYKECFGDDYLAGNYGGPCKGLMDCAIQCQDCDQACLTDCSNNHFDGACKTCITGPILDCVIGALTGGKCTIPCGPSTGGGICDDLEACCNSLAEDDGKQDCLTTYGTVKLGGDAACKTSLDTYKLSGKCQ